MKLVILAAAIIIAKTIENPLFLQEKKTGLIALCVVFGAWEVYDYYVKLNKKQ